MPMPARVLQNSVPLNTANRTAYSAHADPIQRDPAGNPTEKAPHHAVPTLRETSPLRYIEHGGSHPPREVLPSTEMSAHGVAALQCLTEPTSGSTTCAIQTADGYSQSGTALTTSQLEALCAKGKNGRANFTIWHGIQTTYAYTNNVYSPSQLGIATWSDLNAVLRHALAQDQEKQIGTRLSITLHDHLQVDTCLPTPPQHSCNNCKIPFPKPTAPKRLRF